MVDTEHNQLAVSYLKEAQLSLKLNNREFARALGDNLGLVISESTYSYIVSGRTRRQPVPAAMLVAAARLSGLPLLNEAAERTLAERLGQLEAGLGRVEGLVRQLIPSGGGGSLPAMSQSLPGAE